jgi:Tol biopolymer transport system component
LPGVIRLAAALISLFAFTVPTSGGAAASEAARLSYSVSALKSGSPQERLVAAGLCLADANGAEGDRLTAPKQDSGSAWSPDGRRVAFSRVQHYSDGSYRSGIYVQDERGRTRAVIEVSTNGSFFQAVSSPNWSPNGQSLVFSSSSICVRGCLPSSSIYSIRPDGSDLRRLTEPGYKIDFDPAWSPRGDAIVFMSLDEGPPGGEGRGLYLIDPDGGNRRLLVPDGFTPSWSPDGASVVFARWGANLDWSRLEIIGADGRGQRVLTSQPGAEENPAWSPDGDWIAFEQRAGCGPTCGGGREGTDIAVIRPDGTDLHVLRGSSLAELDPAWRPPAPKRPGKQRPCVIRGTHRADAIRGSSRGDLILAGGGWDSISGGGGDDVIDGGPGADRILGGPGADSLIGGFGHDRIAGGAGNDFLDSDDGWPDVVIGNSGRDEATVDSHDRVSSVENVKR